VLQLGTTADFESNTKSYTAKVKATTGDRDNQNIEQTITVNLADLNDETPTDITSTGNLNIAENTTVNTNLVTLSATDADEGDTFSYTLVNNSAAYFAISGTVFPTMIRLPVRVISEGVSSLTSVMLKVKVLSKVCELASVTLTVILQFRHTLYHRC
jgi:hypothetical protein